MVYGLLGQTSTGVILGVVFAFLVISVILTVLKLVLVGNPSEMLIISGKRQRDGQGYRTLIGGRTLVIPILERSPA